MHSLFGPRKSLMLEGTTTHVVNGMRIPVYSMSTVLIGAAVTAGLGYFAYTHHWKKLGVVMMGLAALNVPAALVLNNAGSDRASVHAEET